MLKKLILLAAAIPLAFVFTGCDSDSGGGGGSSNLVPVGGGFLWKPRSESTGNLVVLFPTEYRGRHAGSSIHSADPPNNGNKIVDGVFHTESHNGNRVHYRYDRPGSAFGSNVYIYLYLEDGSKVGYFIPNGAGRVE